ncbi:hypothetical protein RND71_039834 [Anisodus tanguticus]|uniref:F-box domain-containing protein n=1 Tax=Anisodus tanguticus TaxID=243964 RepID=A0AAE1UR06_9SOLA|nr:hypothetical protein RND71_039834 [Anisodus tanguticus]
MESKGDESFRQHPRRIKPKNRSQFLSTSMQDSSRLMISTLPLELITEILLKLPVKSLMQLTWLQISRDCGFCQWIDLSYQWGKRIAFRNPTVRKYKKLCDSRPRLKSYNIVRYDFGYDELHDDYKVVVGNHCKFVNGKLHWAAINCLHENNGRGSPSIISVDMANEKWGKVEQPACVEGDFSLRLGVLENDLSVLYNYYTTRIDVWVMKEYGLKNLGQKCVSSNVPVILRGLWFSKYLCMLNKREILLGFGSTSMIYNSKDATIKYAEITNFDSLILTCKIGSKAKAIEEMCCPNHETWVGLSVNREL